MSKLEGLPINDAKKPLTMTIEPQDVAASSKQDPGKCAAALALAREYHTEVRVHLSRVYIKDKNGKSWMRYETSSALRTEIVSFDRGGDFQCGEYIAMPLRPSARTGARQGSNKTHRSPKNKPRTPSHVLDNVRIHSPATHGS